MVSVCVAQSLLPNKLRLWLNIFPLIVSIFCNLFYHSLYDLPPKYIHDSPKVILHKAWSKYDL